MYHFTKESFSLLGSSALLCNSQAWLCISPWVFHCDMRWWCLCLRKKVVDLGYGRHVWDVLPSNYGGFNIVSCEGPCQPPSHFFLVPRHRPDRLLYGNSLSQAVRLNSSIPYLQYQPNIPMDLLHTGTNHILLGLH